MAKQTLDKAQQLAETLLTDKHVYNNEETIDYRVSTGSLALDVMTGGGITPGVTRLVGTSMGGKTSESFQIMQQAFKDRKRCRGVYIKAEKMSKNTEARIGVPLTLKPEEWVNHTCLMVETIVFENVANFIVDLVYNNIELPPEEREQFIFIVDSVDFLILKDDLKKRAGEAHKVAGPQLLMKLLLKVTAAVMQKFGHIGLFISQVTAQPKIDPYAKVDPRVGGDVGGGNALLHAAENIFEFKHRTNKDYILENQKEVPNSITNKTLGHVVNIILRKSDNEKYNQKVKYPIRYGKQNGESVWRAREVADYAVMYGFFDKNGSWFEVNKQVQDKITKVNKDFPLKIQGLNTIYELLEQNPDVSYAIEGWLMNSLNTETVSEPSDESN